MLFNKQLDKAHAGLPDLRPPLPAVGRGAARAAPRSRDRGPSATPASSRSTRSGSSTRSRTRTAWPRPRRRPGCATRPSGGPASIGGDARRDLRHGLRVHGRLDGRGRRREGHPGRRARARGADPADRRQRIGWRADAGGHARADAAGQDPRRARAPARRPASRSCRVLSDPTTGGVFASFAAVGDVNIAEPNALIGFAGSRVSAGTIAQELPPGFQRAEFLFSHGFIDRVVAAPELRDELDRLLLRLLRPATRRRSAELRPTSTSPAFRPFSFLSTLAERVGELAVGDAPTTTARARDRTAAARRAASTRRRTTSGRASSSPATCAGRGRSSSSRR